MGGCIIKKDIYIIKNKVNDLCYIGQSVDVRSRFRHHLADAERCDYKYKCPFYDAINELGRDMFYYEILEHSVDNPDEREVYWIERLNTRHPHGYNLASGGTRYPNLSGILSHMARIKLDTEILEIYRLLSETDLSLNEIGDKFGVSYNMIADINAGRTYCHNGYSYPIRRCMLSAQEVDRITFDLKYSDMSTRTISELYNVSMQTVASINAGRTWRRDFLTYPIRKTTRDWRDDPNVLDKIKHDLTHSDLSYDQIATKYGCTPMIVCHINLGETARDDGASYPLRAMKGNRVIDQEELESINHKLLYTDESIRSIASEFGVSDATIKRINSGRTRSYRCSQLKYPLRSL